MSSTPSSSKARYPILQLHFGYARYRCEINSLVSFCFKSLGDGWSVVMEKDREVVICTFCLSKAEAEQLYALAEQMRELPSGEITEWPNHVCSDHNTTMFWNPDKEEAAQKKLSIG